jgi:hypothetical protein
VSEAFNPYRQWLQLNVDQPQSDYELLGLKPFEASGPTIAAAADKAITRVRSHRPGDQAARWSRLLDELNTAKRRLGDPSAKSQYDDQLRSGAKPVDKTPAPQPAKASYTETDFRYPPGMNGGGAPKETVAAVPSAPKPVPAPEPEPQPFASAPVPEQPSAPTAAPWATATPWPAPQPQMAAPMAGMPMPGQGMPVAYAIPMQPGMMQPGMMQPPYGMPGQMAAGMPGQWPGQQPMMPGWYSPMQAPMPPAPPPPPPIEHQPPMAQPWEATAPTHGGVIDPMAPVTATVAADPMAALDPMAPLGQTYAMATPVAADGSALPMGTAVGAASEVETPLANVSAPSTSGAVASRARSASAGPLVAMAACACAGGVALIVYLSLTGGGKEPEVAENPQRRVTEIRDHRPSTPTVPTPIAPVPRPAPPTPTPPMPKPVDPTVTMKPVDPAPMPEPMPKPPEPTPEPVPPKPPEPAPPKPETPLPSKKDVADLSKALTGARLALSEGNVEEANIQLASVEKLPMLPEHAAMYHRLKMLADYNGQFWDAVKEGTKSFEGASELPVGNTVISVVEVLPDDRIILKIAGSSRTYPLKELKAGIAMAIAEKWFKPGDPTALVMKGAYAAVNKAGNVERAKEWWGQAIAGGVDVKGLLPVIEDRYDAMEKDLETAAAAREPKKEAEAE